MRSTFLRTPVAFVLAMCAVPLTAALLTAHQSVRASTPARGAMLTAAPPEVRLTFAEPVDLSLTQLLLTGAAGDTVALGPLRLHPDSATVLLAAIIGAQSSGSHRLHWRTVGRDGHVVSGTVEWSLARAVDPPAVPGTADTSAATVPVPPGPIPPEEAARRDPALAGGAGPGTIAAHWFRLLALILVIGSAAAPVMFLRASGAGLLGDAGSRAAAIGAVAALVLIGAALVRLGLQLSDIAAVAPAATTGERATLVLRSYWGVGWLLEIIGALAVLAGFLVARRTGRHRWLAVVGAFVLAAAAATTGHSAAGTLPALTIPLDALHVLGAGGWLGTLAVLVLVALPTVRRLPEASRGTVALTLFRAFSPFALTCAAVVAATGVAAAAFHLGQLGALWRTSYGLTLLAKVAAVVILAALGAWNWQRATPRLTTNPHGVDALRRSAAAEVAMAALIIFVTAVLILTPLPRP